jgi:hypothetical protein
VQKSSSVRQSDQNRLAEKVIESWSAFEEALGEKGRYPKAQFHAFADSVRGYLTAIESGPMVHRSVASTLNGLTERLQLTRRRTPGDILFEADRLECHFFHGYDPCFEGDEPPGL